MVSRKAAVRIKIAWLMGGCRGSAAVGEVMEFVRSLVLVGDTFRLRTCVVGVAHVEHPGCKQREFLVHVF